MDEESIFDCTLYLIHLIVCVPSEQKTISVHRRTTAAMFFSTDLRVKLSCFFLSLTCDILHLISPANSESSLCQVRATVMLYDEINKRWVPAGSESPSFGHVQIYHNSATNTFRVVSRNIQADQKVKATIHLFKLYTHAVCVYFL